MSNTVLHHIDDPPRWDAATPNLILRGWCFDQEGDTIVAVELVSNRGTFWGPVGLSRPDVAAAFGHKPGSATSGFVFWVPNRASAIESMVLRAVHRDGSRTDLRAIQPIPCSE